jgi:hypothetical protein
LGKLACWRTTSSRKLDNEQVLGLTLNQAVEKMRGPVSINIALFCVRVGSPASIPEFK